MAAKKSYRWCFVPLCTNTTIRTPEKVFVTVPQDKNRRKLWFKLAGRQDEPTQSNFFCCEDHFNLKEDMENYVRFSLMGGPIKMKPNVVPHIFACHPGRKCISSEGSRPASLKRKRRAEVDDMLAVPGCSSWTGNEENVPDNRQTSAVVNPAPEMCSSTTPGSTLLHWDEPSNEPPMNVPPKFANKAVQVNMRQERSFRSVHVSCNLKPCTADAAVSTEEIKTKNVGTSPIRFRLSKNPTEGVPSANSSSAVMTTPIYSSEWEPHTSDEKELDELNKIECQGQALSLTNYFISMHPKNYIGLSEDWCWVIELLNTKTHIRADYIKLALMKIRLDDTFQRLGEQFGISTSQASKVFSSTVPRLAHMLKTLIYFPSEDSVRKALPIPFRANYSNVQSIIDCFEIEIEKPSDPTKPALTWSEYKKCNTLKYLISSTPDGFINFISSGYGGRISDSLLFEVSGIMRVRPNECGVMADRGFKQIQTILNQKKCILIRPPTVSTAKKPTKAEVLETKRIASLRIHIERVIRRIRESRMVVPHACIHHSLMPLIDDILRIISGLINLQSPIIKT